MINLNGIIYAILIAIVIGTIGGYFVGKKYGRGHGTLAGFGITILFAFLLFKCKPCQDKLRSIGEVKPKVNKRIFIQDNDFNATESDQLAFATGGKVVDSSLQKTASTIVVNKSKWSFNSISSYTPGAIVLSGASKLPTSFMVGYNIIITNQDTNDTVTGQILQIFPILPSPKNMVSQKVLVKLTGNMLPPSSIKGWIEVA